jgi:DNA-binding beta-propeller fold protein YncE
MRTLLPLLCVAAACTSADDAPPTTPNVRVGRAADGTQTTPVNQTLTPVGTFVDLPGLRPLVLAASRDGRHFYTSGKTAELLVLDAASGEVVQRVALPSDRQTEPPSDPNAKEQRPDKDGQVSFTGLVVAPDGRTIWMSNVRGSIKVFAVDEAGNVAPSHSIPLPPANAPRRDAEIPTGLALSADAQRLYVCGNLGNRLLELDATTGAVVRTFAVGVAPYDVVLAGGRAFVSNQGGRRPEYGDAVGPAGRGTLTRVDHRDIASEGSVTVIDLASGTKVAETVTGRLASDLAVSPDGRFVVCANAGSDTISVLDRNGALVETLWARKKPSDLLQASPNAVCFAHDGERLFVANGTMNAIAVFTFDPDDRGDSALRGYVPVGWYPAAMWVDDQRDQLAVVNIRGLGPGRPRQGSGVAEWNSHQHHGSLSLVPLASFAGDLAAHSARVDANLRRDAIEQALLPPRPAQPPRAIPERIGEPSRIRHVVYVIKENRTYDQVLGDIETGNGDPELCVFPAAITPNQHALARQFVLLDNTYCSGILSADGHQWSTAAFATSYLERSFAGWPRSYPDGMGEDEKDALSYSPAGFLWDHAIARGITLRNYGEFCEPNVRWRDPQRPGEPDFAACYAAWRGMTDDVVFASAPTVRSLVPYSATDYVGWNMAVPDQHRADVFLRELAAFEAKGEFPQLVLICLPNDHTSGATKGCPTPAACVADNDLAFGRIVEGLSKSRFWPQMAIFGIEDDPQAGWDHVSGYRTTCYVASPFARRGVTVSTQYNTTSVLRTIEQILGIPPMNVFDASATPMSDCFTETPDLTPFTALPASVPLDQMNPEPVSILDPALRADAETSATLNFAQIDKAPEDVLNRILWRAMRGSAVPYPEWAITPDADDDDEEEAAEERARQRQAAAGR